MTKLIFFLIVLVSRVKSEQLFNASAVGAVIKELLNESNFQCLTIVHEKNRSSFMSKLIIEDFAQVHSRIDYENGLEKSLKICQTWLLKMEGDWNFSSRLWTSQKPHGNLILGLSPSKTLVQSSLLQLGKMFSQVFFMTYSEKSYEKLQVWTRVNSKQQFELTSVISGEIKANYGLIKREQKFNGEILLASAFHVEPYTIFTDEGNASGGFEFNIASAIAKALNLSLVVRAPLDGQLWGFESPVGSGNFSGLLGELSSAKVDLGWANLFIQRDRARLMDFSKWYRMEITCAAVPKAEPNARLLINVEKFHFVMVFLLILAFLATLTLFLLHFLTLPSEICLVPFVASVLCSVSHPSTSRIKYLHLRLGMTFVLLGTMVLAHLYGGSLVSMLSVEEQTNPINTLIDLAKAHQENRIDKIVSCCANVDQFLVKSEIKELQYISSIAVKNVPTVTELARHFRAINERRDRAVFHISRTIDFMIRKNLIDERGQTNVHVMKECFLPARIAFGLRKRSLLKHRIDAIIRGLGEAGLIEKYIGNAMDSVGELRIVEGNNEVAEALDISNFKVLIVPILDRQ